MKQRLKRLLPDLLIAAFLLAIPLIFFFPQTLGGRTILPVDNLFQFEPYKSLAPEYGIGVPHNALISDLILENYAWKQFALRQIRAGQLPLWQPNIAAGAPFLAAGQSSILYPFSLIFLILPLWSAFGWFTVSQLWLAGLTMYLLARVLGLRRFGALVAGLAYQLSGFMLVSVVFPMILAVAAWLPFEIAMLELTIRAGKAFGGREASLPWVALGAAGLGMAALAGHVEALYFTLLVMAYYAGFRLIAGAIAARQEPGLWGKLFRRAGWLIVLVVLGLSLGAVQIIPGYELASRSFREGAVSLDQVLDWAYPPRRLIAFLMPNFFGNPSHHRILDAFSLRWLPLTANALGEPVNNTAWGIKNYVEGGAYLGIAVMALALLALIQWLASRLPQRYGYVDEPPTPEKYIGGEGPGRPYRLIFAVLGLLSLSFAFGTPTYALLYYGLPFINQSHSPFRWVWPMALAAAALAGYGVEWLQTLDARRHDRAWRVIEQRGVGLIRVVGWVAIGAGGLLLIALVLSRLFFARIEPTVQRVFEGLALAPNAFPDGRAFYSYQFWNALILALMLLASGGVLWLNRAHAALPIPERLRRYLPVAGEFPLWLGLLPLLIALDAGIGIWGFYPANDPALLAITPPAIARLQADTLQGRSASLPPADTSPYLWRFIAYEEPGADTMNSNVGWLFDLQDASAYDSLIPAQYAAYMELIQPQTDLPYNRIAPLYTTHPDALDSPLLDLLGVRYVVTEVEIDSPKYALAYQDEAVRIYENMGVMPRAYTMGERAEQFYDGRISFAEAVTHYDVHRFALIKGDQQLYEQTHQNIHAYGGYWDEAAPATITTYTTNELWIDVATEGFEWLIVTDSYFPGWRAWIRPHGADDSQEVEAPIWQAAGNFRAVWLEEPGTWTVRMKYSPDSLKLGAFASFMAGMVVVFMAGVWLWRYVYREGPDDSAARRVAKNSLTPIILNLFNRGIQFAFAFIMLRILGPEGSGKYQYAVVIWGWFEIVSNFGLDTFLLREVARHKDQAGRYLASTTTLRLILALLGVPLLGGFIWMRQNVIAADPLTPDTITALWVLYGGLFLSTINKGLTGLFYAFEKAEYPAATQTIGTILTASLGVIVLLMELEIVGLAGVSVVVNLVTLVLLTIMTARLFSGPEWKLDHPLAVGAVIESFPLMINHLLATLFFRIDVILLEAIKGPVVVGWYGIVYKWIDALNIIPSFFTQALFPIMSVQAREDRAALRASYILSVKLLTLISAPLAVITTLLASFLVGLLGGSEFLPHGAMALQIFVWSIPIGWINSVTNYVIIALDRQRILTWAFVVGVIFNVAANLVFIPRYSYAAAAAITILSEGVLLIFFYRVMRPALGGVGWFGALWRIAAGAALMAGATFALAGVSVWLGLAGGLLVYGAAMWLLRPFTATEIAALAPVVPGPLRDRVAAGVVLPAAE